MRLALIGLFLSFALISFSQTAKPLLMDADQNSYYTIPEAPTDFRAPNVAARMIDGLGFRYYWGTEGLRSEDLKYKPSESGRTVEETLEHIHGLVNIALCTVKNIPVAKIDLTDLVASEVRTQTLLMIKEASDLLRNSDANALENMHVIFQRGDKTSTFPFWNLLNGPLADAIWHVGQIVTLRRASGNPISGKISVFSGTVRE